MSLLHSSRRPSSDALALHPRSHGAVGDAHGSPGSAPNAERPFVGAFGDEPDGPRVDLGRSLDLSAERPHVGAPAGRGPGLLVAGIVATSITLGVIIMMVRNDGSEAQPIEAATPAAIIEASAPAEPLPVEAAAPPVKTEPVPPATRVAAQRVPAASKGERAPEITPAAIAPKGPARPTAPASRPTSTTPADDAAGGLAPGLDLPAPVFDEPAPTEAEPATPPASAPASPTDDASDERLPAIEERLPVEPRDEPKPEPESAEPGGAALPS